ncbi:YunG family protein [Bradyrhizobium sp. cf659]|uniref:YunG family protein n=1 Tax=Bradyrhizobium sp. cf659 TaxID=1761771 RepID=UPI000B819DB3
MSFDPDDVQRALRRSWSLSTASQWTSYNPAAGQCNVASLLIHDLFGGELLKTPLPVRVPECTSDPPGRPRSAKRERPNIGRALAG